MDPMNNRKSIVRRPEVFKKINDVNLHVIERGLLRELPEKLRPQPPVPVRGRPTELNLEKHTNVFTTSCLPVLPASPRSEKASPSIEEVSPLKKSFSFRDKFSRLSFLGKNRNPEKSKWRTTNEDDGAHATTITSDTKHYAKDKDQDHKHSKRFWLFKGKEEYKAKPQYKRSKSFEFLPRAVEEEEVEIRKTKKSTTNRHSFVHNSTDSLNEDWTSTDSLLYENPNDNVFVEQINKKSNYYLDDIKEQPVNCVTNNSSVSTVNTSNNSSERNVNTILETPSFINLLEDFDKVVELFNENYLSDTEPYTRRNKNENIVEKKEKRKSSSFSNLPSPKVLQLNTLKVSEISEDFKRELSVAVFKKHESEVPVQSANCRTSRRGSVTDWFVLEEPVRSSSDQNKYRRAQKKPVNRVRRISSTKYDRSKWKYSVSSLFRSRRYAKRSKQYYIIV